MSDNYALLPAGALTVNAISLPIIGTSTLQQLQTASILPAYVINSFVYTENYAFKMKAISILIKGCVQGFS